MNYNTHQGINEKVVFKCPNPECQEANGFNIVVCEACFKSSKKRKV